MQMQEPQLHLVRFGERLLLAYRFDVLGSADPRQIMYSLIDCVGGHEYA